MADAVRPLSPRRQFVVLDRVEEKQPADAAAAAVPMSERSRWGRKIAAGEFRDHHRDHPAGIAEGVAIARETLARVRDHVAGVQVSAPLGRVDLALDVLDGVIPARAAIQ